MDKSDLEKKFNDWYLKNGRNIKNIINNLNSKMDEKSEYYIFDSNDITIKILPEIIPDVGHARSYDGIVYYTNVARTPTLHLYFNSNGDIIKIIHGGRKSRKSRKSRKNKKQKNRKTNRR